MSFRLPRRERARERGSLKRQTAALDGPSGQPTSTSCPTCFTIAGDRSAPSLPTWPRRYDRHPTKLARSFLPRDPTPLSRRSEEHPSELQSLMRISYAFFSLQKQKIHTYLPNSP